MGAPTLLRGRPTPLGPSTTPRGTNLCIYARSPTATLLLWAPADDAPVEHVLDARFHRTGLVWHAELVPAAPGIRYRWRVARHHPRWPTDCLDPCATVLHVPRGPAAFNRTPLADSRPAAYAPWAVVPAVDHFDWQNVVKPRLRWSQLVIYEIHVRGFTKRLPEIHPDIKPLAGTFAGVVAQIPYLVALGINCVELLPIMEYNETEWSHISPTTNKPLSQYWGYSTVAFFVPMGRFATDGSDPQDVVPQFKYMVRELHRVGIEVILDVVYNHTAEMGLDYVGPGFYGMKQLAPFSYYLLKNNGETYVNHSGCGNTVNSNNPVVQELIHDSLRYWAHEMQVDGFRFDLASVLCRGTDGEPLAHPPIIERISKDPTMRDVKLIAEPWDCGGLYQVGSFPHFGAWAEWNGKFRDCVRRFIKGDHGMIGEFATRLCGSQDLYGDGRKPYHSINFVTAHDGFSLWDLVSYNHKHNEDNGEKNNDGEAHNDSWNCGAEGDTDNEGIMRLRGRQVKNFVVALMLSAGTPMLRMGDEYGHTQRGNNNGWCQDSTLTWFDWEKAKSGKDDMVRFTQLMIDFRQAHANLQREDFLSERDITWHGARSHDADWHSSYNLLGCSLRGEVEIYVAFNAGGDQRDVELPGVEGGWDRVVDTQLDGAKSFCVGDAVRHLDGGTKYGLAPFSCIVLRQARGSWRSSPQEAVGQALTHLRVKMDEEK